LATFTETEIRAAGRRRAGQSRTATARLNEEIALESSAMKTYDVFLSHSVKDAEIVLGVKAVLESHLKTVYVDWVDDPQLDGSRVNPATADALRARMQQCRTLIYVHTENSPTSRWMPWELGYFDGFRGAVAILPVTATKVQEYKGQEYLGIYPYVDEGMVQFTTNRLRVRRGRTDNREWAAWAGDPRTFRVTG
jgi:hypothetical protein